MAKGSGQKPLAMDTTATNRWDFFGHRFSFSFARHLYKQVNFRNFSSKYVEQVV